MASILWRRDITSSMNGVKSTFSSWNSCMAKAYCKWPVIVAIIIGSCIVLSVVFCVARCLCCGAECACCCFTCCRSCCPSPSRRKDHKRVPSPLGTPSFGGPVHSQYRSHPSPAYEPPQYARFDDPSKPVNEDALPAMPSWGDATRKKVEDDSAPQQDVELKDLDKDGNAAAAVPMLTHPAKPSPIRSPGSFAQPQAGYGFPNKGYQQLNNSHDAGIHRQPSPGFHTGQDTGVYHDQQPYHDHSPGFPPAGGYANGGGYRSGGRSPLSPYHDQPPYDDHYAQSQHGQAQHGHAPAPYDNFRRNNSDNQTPRSNSPRYAPSGTTRYEPSHNGSFQGQSQNTMHLPQHQQPRLSPTGGWHTNPTGRRPVNNNGGWRDV